MARVHIHGSVCIASIVLLLAVLSACRHMWGQGPTLKASSTLVVVPTLVRSPKGDLVHGLDESDFRLTDNGVAQRVTLEDEHDIDRQPLSIVVLMQTGGGASRQFANYAHLQTTLEYMVGSSAHRAALVTFDSQPEDIWDFTPRIGDLQDGFLHPIPGDNGASIRDAVNFGIDLLQKEPVSSRRVLILLSQTRDEGSRTSSEELVRHLGKSNITIYSLAFSVEKTWLKDQFTKPRHGNAPYQRSPMEPPLIGTFDLGTPLMMAVHGIAANTPLELAAQSGGEYIEFGSRGDVERQMGLIANHIPNRYTLSFRPSSSQAGFHALRVGLPDRPGLQVSARGGYWAAQTEER